MRRLTSITLSLLIVCNAPADEEDHRTVLKRLVTGTVQSDALQAVEKASDEHFYDVLRLALWSPLTLVRVEAAERLRNAPIAEQAKIWCDLLLDDSQWDWEDMGKLREDAQVTIRNIMLASLRPSIGEIPYDQVMTRKGRYDLVKTISEKILHESISLPALPP